MHNADSTIADLAHAAGVSRPTFDATRGHLVRGDLVEPLIRSVSSIDYRSLPPQNDVALQDLWPSTHLLPKPL
jgi:hypothetical protein